MNERFLYHGTIYSFEEVKILDESSQYKDFGKGFYLSDVDTKANRFARIRKDRADRIEREKKKINKAYKMKNIIGYRYDFIFYEDLAYNNLRIKKFDSIDAEWLKFVMLSRLGVCKENYDIVIGQIADDNTKVILSPFDTVDKVMRLTDVQCARIIDELCHNKIDMQYVFKTERSLKFLKFRYDRKRVIVC